MTLGSHQRTVGASQNHLTPKWIIDALGPFDFDPCASHPLPWPCAFMNYHEGGLERDWWGLVWLNPPFDRYQVGRWIERLAEHGQGIALLHARTETAWFRPVWRHATALLFLSERLKFCRPDGTPQAANSGAPAVLCAFGDEARQRLARLAHKGITVTEWSPR